MFDEAFYELGTKLRLRLKKTNRIFFYISKTKHGRAILNFSRDNIGNTDIALKIKWKLILFYLRMQTIVS